jgi:hypothetical protein
MLMVQDITELDYSRHADTQELGSIGDHRGQDLYLPLVGGSIVRPANREIGWYSHVLCLSPRGQGAPSLEW